MSLSSAFGIRSITVVVSGQGGLGYFCSLLTNKQGVNYIEEEFRGQESKACIEVREAQMSQLDMQDFNQRRLGWRKRKNPNGGEASRETEPYDSEGGYCW